MYSHSTYKINAMIYLIISLLFINHLLPYHECRIFDKKSLPRDYIADGLKLQSVSLTRSPSPIKLYKSGSHYKPTRSYGKDYDYETGESVEDEFEEEFVPLKSSKDKEPINDHWPNRPKNNNEPESHGTDKFPSNYDNIGTKKLSKIPDDSPISPRIPEATKSGESSSDPKDWKYQVCEEFLLREAGISKIPKALRYHVDIDDHKRLNINPPLDKREMIKCLRNLAIIRGTNAKLKGLEHLNNIKHNFLSPNPFSAPSSSLIPPSSSPSRWSPGSSSDADRQSLIIPSNLEANRARLLSRLSEEQIRKLLLLLTEMLDKRMKPSPELGKVPIHGKLTPLMFSHEMGFKHEQRRQAPLPPGHPSSISPSSGSKFPLLTPLSGSGSTTMDGGPRNLIDPVSSPIHYNNNLGLNLPSSRGLKPFPQYSSGSFYSRHPFQPPLPSHPGFTPFLTSSYPLPSPLLPNNLHPATQVTRFPFTSPSGVKKLLINEVLGVKKIEKYNGEREVEVGGGPKTVVVHEGELHVDPSGESAAIEIDENKMKRYRDSLMAAYGRHPLRLSGIHGHGMSFPGRNSPTSERYGSSFYDSFRDSGFFNDLPFPSSGPSLASSSSSQTELSALPVSPPPLGRYHRDRHHHHRHQSYHHNNANEYVYSSDQGSTSLPPPGVQITKCDESGKCTGSPGSIVGEEESIKSKYKANNSATRAAYGRYGAKYLGLTLTSIANYALGNLMGVLYAPFMKGRDQEKNGKPGKRPEIIPIGGRPVKGMFDPSSSSFDPVGGGHNEVDKITTTGAPGKGQPLDNEIDNLLDDYDDVDGDNNKAERRRKRRRRR